MTRLHDYLKKKKLDGEVQLKKTSDYTSDDVLNVLELAEKVQKTHENATKGPGWIPKLRRFARSFSRHALDLKSLMDFIPDTTYTSVVCACLTGILMVSTITLPLSY
jgi:hypothetical protein